MTAPGYVVTCEYGLALTNVLLTSYIATQVTLLQVYSKTLASSPGQLFDQENSGFQLTKNIQFNWQKNFRLYLGKHYNNPHQGLIIIKHNYSDHELLVILKISRG